MPSRESLHLLHSRGRGSAFPPGSSLTSWRKVEKSVVCTFPHSGKSRTHSCSDFPHVTSLSNYCFIRVSPFSDTCFMLNTPMSNTHVKHTNQHVKHMLIGAAPFGILLILQIAPYSCTLYMCALCCGVMEERSHDDDDF